MSPKEEKVGRKKIYAMVASIVAVATVALLLGFVVFSGSSTGTLSTTVTASSGGPSEGVVVHGYWTIEVFNPDGSLAEHREFENALVSGYGSPTLVNILARQNSVGGWEISLIPRNVNEGAFLSETSNPTYGILAESTYPRTYPNLFKTLTVSVGTGDDNLKLVLRGTATAQTNGNIGRVKTLISMLRPASSPSGSYDAVSLNDFTETVLSSPVNLTTNQIVTITVVISFS
jgi:hypothetical protein